jgi:hypothetical protein
MLRHIKLIKQTADNNKKYYFIMQPITGFSSLQNIVNDITKKENVSAGDTTTSKDTAEISDTSKVFSQVDKFLNLGNPDRLDLGKMSPADKEEFLKVVANLLKKGVVGYEVLNVNGQPEKHFIENEIGDSRIEGAKLYNNGNDDAA